MVEGSEVRFLTVEEANRLLPRIEEELREMDLLTARRGELSDLVEDMEAYWGEGIEDTTNPEHESYLRLHSELVGVTSSINDCMVAIHELGGQLKSYEQGLVDFYCAKEGRPIFLCWRRGEERIEYYHELDAGFQGRKPIAL